MDQIKIISDDSNKVKSSEEVNDTILFGIKSEEMNGTILFDEWLTNDLESFLSKNGDFLFTPKIIDHDVSPLVSSSMNTSSIFNKIIKSHKSDSPLFTSISTPDSAKGGFPGNSSQSMRHGLTSFVPAVTIPADDQLSSPICQPDYTSALNIPWEPDEINNPDFLSDSSSSLTSVLVNNRTDISSNSLVTTKILPINSPAKIAATSPAASTPSTSLLTKTTADNSRKRSVNGVEKDSKTVPEELAIKRAKNTDAARKSRLRKVLKMESLEKQVNELKIENKKFQTRVAVLESEKKGLKEKNIEKDNRIRLLEKQLVESHERLINIS
ncbi:16668_t:CDS:1 [Cetraspora pellucida]|uniref:16668_t:CDS:1 n=1 Tax=Cetraspora pellucida TaxID=1433469 RepID=A0A9N9ET02_9GLOM|nr:16668_t:CDS:1 [Cetraspora pellucida]